MYKNCRCSSMDQIKVRGRGWRASYSCGTHSWRVRCCTDWTWPCSSSGSTSPAAPRRSAWSRTPRCWTGCGSLPTNICTCLEGTHNISEIRLCPTPDIALVANVGHPVCLTLSRTLSALSHRWLSPHSGCCSAALTWRIRFLLQVSVLLRKFRRGPECPPWLL